MKQVKLVLLLGILVAVSATPAIAQDEKTLPEVKVIANTYKYLRAVDNKDMPPPVKLLERKAAEYDIKKSEYYDDDNVTYYVSFYLPEGFVLAVYDQDGKLLRTAERYKNIPLPPAITKAVGKRYPNWSISKDIYLVTYEDANGAKRDYKLILQNGSKRIRAKLNEEGTFLD
ncbi:MAG: nicotinate-nucleotide adenylyltransferase [Chitinophagaceae bacterium]|nr:nicotinate-nucleotide adenylyltransferase [Chitinophagaceae bacterium]